MPMSHTIPECRYCHRYHNPNESGDWDLCNNPECLNQNETDAALAQVNLTKEATP